MAELSAGDRALVTGGWMRECTTSYALTKAELRAAIDAMDTWANDNATAFNNAIPQPARGVLTAKQKAWLLLRVIEKRYQVT